jgi:hypothetical protein
MWFIRYSNDLIASPIMAVKFTSRILSRRPIDVSIHNQSIPRARDDFRIAAKWHEASSEYVGFMVCLVIPQYLHIQYSEALH